MGWGVDEVVPITCLLSNLWELLLRYLYCHAMLVDVDLGLSVLVTDVRLLING